MTLKNSERYSIYTHARMCVSAVLWCCPFPSSTTVAVRQRGKVEGKRQKKKKKGWHTPAFEEPTHLPDEFRIDKSQVAQKPKQHDWGSSPDKNKNQNLYELKCIYTFANKQMYTQGAQVCLHTSMWYADRSSKKWGKYLLINTTEWL